MEYTEARKYVQHIVGDLKKEIEEWRPMQTRADVRAYDILGTSHEKAADIDADPVKRVALVDEVRFSAPVKDSKKWSPSGKATTELIVTSLLGLKEARTRRHNWVCTLAYAAECGVAPTKAAFVEWISSERVGGIDGAVAAYRGDDMKVEEIELSEVAASLEKKVEKPDMIDVTVDPEAPGGLAVLLIRRAGEKRSAVLKTSTEAGQIKRVMSDLGLLKRPKRRTPAQIANIERDAVLALNRVAFALADEGKVTHKRVDTFVNAYHRLKKVPELVEKYFDGKPGYTVGYPDHEGKGGVIEEKNKKFDKLDPGRYLTGARKEALIPYPFKVGNPSANRKAALEYLHSFDKPRVEQAERVQNPPTLEPHFKESEIKPAEELEKEES